MGISKFQPLTKSIPLNESKKNSAQSITSARGPHTKFGINAPTEGFWANGWNITKKYFYLYFFFWGTRTGQTDGWIFTRDSAKDVKSRKGVSFGVIKVKFNVKPLFIPQTVKFWPKTGLIFFDRKRVTMGMLKS